MSFSPLERDMSVVLCRHTVAICVLPLVFASPALAHDRAVSASIGASFLQFEAGTGPGIAGDIAADVAGPSPASIGVVGDVAWHRESGVDAFSFAGGARMTLRPGGGRVRPYAQFILGRIRFNEDGGSATANLFAPGGGVQVGLSDAVAVFGQVDVAIVRFEGGDGETGQRYRVGVAWEWR
jgi:hypothetical protein